MEELERKGEPGTYQLVLNLSKEYQFDYKEKDLSSLFKQFDLNSEKYSEIFDEEHNENDKIIFEYLVKKIENQGENKNEKQEKNNTGNEIENKKEDVYEIKTKEIIYKNFLKDKSKFLKDQIKFPFFFERINDLRNEEEKNELEKAEKEIDKITLKDDLFLEYIKKLKKIGVSKKEDKYQFNDLEKNGDFF